MSYLVLARKWRPKSFEDMVGQDHVRRALINALENERLHHAYLFSGTRGVGKTTIARILAKALNCANGITATPCGECSACVEIDEGRFVDLIEVDAASRTKVDDTRELLDNVQYSPARGRFKVYLIDEVHMLSTHSFNALLKTLEEPPPHVKFLLATTDPQKLPVTVLSRCLKFNLKRLSLDLIEERLGSIVSAEGIAADAGGLRVLARAADGSMRDGLSLLDQAIAYGGGEVKEDDVRSMLGSIDQQYVFGLLRCLADGEPRALLAESARLADQVPDYAAVLSDMAGCLQQIALEQIVPDSASEMDDPKAIAELAARLSPEDVQLYYQIALHGARDLRLSQDARSAFQMTLLRMLVFRPAPAGDTSTGGGEAAKRAAPASSTAPASTRTRKPKKEADGTVAVAGNWPEIVSAMNLRGAVRQLANNCVMLARDGSKIALQLDPAGESMLTGQLKDRLRKALSDYFDADISIDIAIERPKQETPNMALSRKADEKLRAARESLDEDPNIVALKETFDATIQEESVRPVD
jgi:DNA polymerase-3 subunit gamma/tau